MRDVHASRIKRTTKETGKSLHGLPPSLSEKTMNTLDLLKRKLSEEEEYLGHPEEEVRSASKAHPRTPKSIPKSICSTENPKRGQEPLQSTSEDTKIRPEEYL